MNLFDLAAVITLDKSKYEQGLNDAQGQAEGFGSKLKSGLSAAASAIGSAVAGASTAVAALAKSAIEGYADYEQLVGGVETLFKGSADIVQEYAANAYKTAGLSANEYMETVTSFSASLLQSVGGDTEKAANLADLAISDMSDNANKMGSEMASIQNAYQGFAKQNYTMLDNLKLGYGGTKSEMERLVADAEKLDSSFKAQRDSSGKLTLSYADVVNAIHIVQNEMDITGTTAKEASSTISGSVSSMKSAWQNLVVGIADENADFSKLVGNFVESVTTVGDNILPRIQQALKGVGQLVQGLAPVIAKAIPMLIKDVLPPLLEAGATMVGTIGEALLSNASKLTAIAIGLVERL